MSDIKTIVAPLFVPANRLERFAKAAASDADAVILDLEDAVAADEKDAAREALDASFTDKPVIVRINAAGTAWHQADLKAVSRLPIAGIILPKAERVYDLARAAEIAPVLPLMETVQGLAGLRTLVSSGHAARLVFGSIDFAADMGCAHERGALAFARSEIVFASRLAGLPAPIDGVTTNVTDMQHTTDDAAHARLLGFGGKLAIHPRQAASILAGFVSDPAEIDWARRVLLSGDGAVKIDGAMVDEPVRIRARLIVARAAAARRPNGLIA